MKLVVLEQAGLDGSLERVIIDAVWRQVPLRQDYGTKVNLFSHLHQYSRKKPLTQQMRYVASARPPQPRPVALLQLSCL